MTKIKIMMAVFIFFALIGAVRDNGPVSPGEMYFMHVNVDNNNNGNDKLEGLSTSMFIYNLGVYVKSGNFDLGRGDVDAKMLFWDVPYGTKPGNYIARVVVSNDDERKVTHRLVTII